MQPSKVPPLIGAWFQYNAMSPSGQQLAVGQTAGEEVCLHPARGAPRAPHNVMGTLC